MQEKLSLFKVTGHIETYVGARDKDEAKEIAEREWNKNGVDIKECQDYNWANNPISTVLINYNDEIPEGNPYLPIEFSTISVDCQTVANGFIIDNSVIDDKIHMIESDILNLQKSLELLKKNKEKLSGK